MLADVGGGQALHPEIGDICVNMFIFANISRHTLKGDKTCTTYSEVSNLKELKYIDSKWSVH